MRAGRAGGAGQKDRWVEIEPFWEREEQKLKKKKKKKSRVCRSKEIRFVKGGGGGGGVRKRERESAFVDDVIDKARSGGIHTL